MPNKRILVLGGTSDANVLARELLKSGFEVVTSFAGVTENPVLPEGEIRVGGFGGEDGLFDYLKAEGFAALADATHPFAAQISRHGFNATERAGIRNADVFFALTRGDNTNLMAAQIVKIRYKVDRVCVKVADPMRSDAYQKLGYFCINPSSLTSGMMRDWLTSEPFGPIDQYNVLVKEMSL